MTKIKALEQPSWHFHNPVQLIVGRGSRSKLLSSLNKSRVLIVTTVRGRAQFTNDKVLSQVLENNNVAWVDSVKENPGLKDLQREIDKLQGTKVDAIIAFGGGSAMDAAKTLRAGLAVGITHSLHEMLTHPELHESAQLAPLYALPTTAGTGSEVTPFATIWHHEVHQKLSLSGDNVFPTMAIVDAELTDAVPMQVTLSTGLDAINQAGESIWNKNANPITLGYATRALQLGFHALPLLISGEGGAAERAQMAEASVLAGLAISHTRTALCHSISYPLTAHFNVPHGLACAFTMPTVCKLNLSADDGRFTELAKALTGESDLGGLHQMFVNLNQQLGVTNLVKSYIPSLERLIALESEMYNPSRADNNLVFTGNDKISEILQMSWISTT